MKFEQSFVDDVMAGALALADICFEMRLQQFAREQRDDCSWSSQEIAEWQREARVAYTIWRTNELAAIELEFFAAQADERPEPRVLQ